VTQQDQPVPRSGHPRSGRPWTPEEWQRIDAIFQEAITLAASERPAFLDRVCSSPDDRRKLESLLELHERGTDFLEPGVGRIAAEVLGSQEYALAAGDRLGPYSVVRALDRGGMGVVYLGHDTRLDRPVAIKLLPPAFAGDLRQRERLRREARAAASVSHAGVAHVYALEEDEHGAAFIVSEFVDGHTLRAEIARGPLPPPRAVHTAIQVARAGGAAHARQIVHRDLKPENVMRSSGGQIKVLDFGLALLLSPRGGDALTRLTVAGTLLGTLGYMSPEQLAGDEATPASDVFALGLLLHELVTGAHAFAGPHPASHLARIVDHEPNRLPPEVNAAMPGLADVVHRCLEKSPSRRYGSMDELATALEALGGRTAIAARRSGSGAVVARESGEVPTGSGEATDLWWWQVHQVVVSVFYGLALVPVWLVRSAFASGGLHAALFVLAVAATAIATSVRLHLVFTSRVRLRLLARARQRNRLLVRASDGLMSLSLLAAGGVALLAGRPEIAALLAALAACATIAFLVIEPATESAAFSDDDGAPA
jgi:hypothetical protein